MLVADAAKLPPVERFLYWIRERHEVYRRRQAGRPKPWTDDEVLRNYFFTNPYREHDKVTAWFRENIRDPLRDDQRVLFATVCFRWFNLPATGRLLLGGGLGESSDLLSNWDPAEAVRRLAGASAGGNPVFTGAYMIKGEKGLPKINSVCGRISAVWGDRRRLVRLAWEAGTLREVWAALLEFPYLGGFMSYEVVCDLRHTHFLADAEDVDTWCHPGPGCARGLMRLDGLAPPKNRFGNQKRHGNKLPADWPRRMAGLLELVRDRLPGLPHLEMREIEHSLCEFDKYERARLGDGRMKRTYRGA